MHAYIPPLVGIFGFLLLLETFFPLRKRTQPRARRYISNFLTFVFLVITASYTVVPASIFSMELVKLHHLGVLQFISLPPFLQLIVAFLLMDLSFYYWHRLNHEWPLLWRFHNVHHIDPDLDVTTSLRFHVVEVAYSAFFRFIQVLLIGVWPIVFVSYELCFQVCTYFHHSNIKLPLQLERLLVFALVTPRMHGIHHSSVTEERNRNYGVIFSFWDRLHRTLTLNIPQQKLTIGVAAYSSVDDNRIHHLLSIPFKVQREYDRFTDGQLALRNVPANTDEKQLEQ